MKLMSLILPLTFLLCSLEAHASESRALSVSDSDSRTRLDFDGAMVEGLPRPTLDHLETSATEDGRNGRHLYELRKSYLPEMRSMHENMGSLP